MSQGFDTNIANAEQNSRPARKNKTLAEIKEIQQSLVVIVQRGAQRGSGGYPKIEEISKKFR